MSNKKRIEYLKSRGIPQDMEFSESRILQRDHIEEMKSYVDFQNHTEFHVSLPQCSEEEAKDEIFRSKEILEKEYGLKIDSLSYPFGDYSDRDIKLLKAAGYKTGITVDFGYNDLKSNLYRLKRISLNDSGDVNEIIVRATGLWAFFKEISGKKIYGFKD